MFVKDNVRQRRQERIRMIMGKELKKVQAQEKDQEQEKETMRQSSSHMDIPVYDKRLEDPEYVWKLKGNAWLENKGGVDEKQWNDWNASPTWGQFKIKLMVSVIIFIMVWAIFQIDHPQANKAKRVVAVLLTEDFQFEKIAVWYDDVFQGAPSFIPIFDRNNEAAKVNARLNRNFFKPVEGVINTPFSVTGDGIQVTTKSKADIVALDAGRVIFIGELKKTGLTVIIQHTNQLQSMYGFMGETFLSVNDWVKGGQWIGTLSQLDGHNESELYFALKQDNQYLNPADIIPFD